MTASAAASAAVLPDHSQHGPVAAWVGGEPVPVAEVEHRLARLRASDRACVLPQADSREGRQLRRWVTQVVVVERLCVAELAARGLGWQGDGTPGMPSSSEAVALGSVAAAAWAGHPAVRRALLVLTEAVRLPDSVAADASRLGATAAGAMVWSLDELLTSARMDAFSKWLARVAHERVRLTPGYEHPGDSSQPDNLHRH